MTSIFLTCSSNDSSWLCREVEANSVSCVKFIKVRNTRRCAKLVDIYIYSKSSKVLKYCSQVLPGAISMLNKASE